MAYNGGWGGGPASSSPAGYNRKRGRGYDDEDDAGGSGKFSRLDQPLRDDRPMRRGRGGRYSGGGYGGGGYGRGPRHSNSSNYDTHDRRGDPGVFLSAGEKYCVDLWRFGDEIPGASTEESSRYTDNTNQDLLDLRQETVDLWSRGSREDVLRGFRIAASELPHKLPWIATLVGLLASEVVAPDLNGKATQAGESVAQGDADMQAEPTPATPATATPASSNIAMAIVKELIRSFQNHLDARRWRSARLSLHLFAHLACLPVPLVTSSSLIDLLHQSFVNALENEFGLRAERGDELVRLVLETLMRLDAEHQDQGTVEVIRNVVGTYMQARNLDLGFLGGDTGNLSQWRDPIRELYDAFVSSDGSHPATLPRPWLEFPSLSVVPEGSQYEPMALPIITLPLDNDLDAAEARVATAVIEDDYIKDRTGYSGVRAEVSLFGDSTVPPRDTNAGVYVRSLLRDIISVFEVNRKDCARILLLDLPKWLPKGTFVSKTENNGDSNGTSDEHSSLLLENVIMESIVTLMLASPDSPHGAAYYMALITDVCKVAPQVAAPALGKCIRKLYSGLGKEDPAPEDVVLGPEGIRRFSQWFATHLSNFAFHWRWPEWEEDLDLPNHHPRKVFITRVLDLEIRLSYHDRIKMTIPDRYLSATAGVFPTEAPAANFTYEPEGTSLYQAPAAEILRLLRSRAPVDEIKEHLERYRKDFMEGEVGDPVDEIRADNIAKDILFQSMLVVGSRSFSHFLNVVERYISLLRELTASADARLALLRSVSRFWSSNSQFLMIVFDKLLQYRVVDPVDAIAWVFEGEQPTLDAESDSRDWTDVTSFEVLRLTLSKINSRVLGATARLESIRKREENRMDTERAAGAETEEPVENDAAKAARVEVEAIEKQLASIKREQQSLYVEVVTRFQQTLSTLDTDGFLDEWSKWFARGWFAEFCRHFSEDIVKHIDALAHVDLPSDGTVYQGLQAAQNWVEFK